MKQIRVLLVSTYAQRGGAGRAAVQIFRALKSVENLTGVTAYFHSFRDALEEPRASSGYHFSSWHRAFFWAQVLLSRLLSRGLLRPAFPSLHSSAAATSGFLRSGQWDAVNLHWIGDASLSIEEIGMSPSPIVWTLHDMWPYSGAEHQTGSRRFVEGYYRWNRPSGESGPDVNRLTWERKKRAWRSVPSVVSPSRWALDNVEQSALMSSARAVQIPHPIDTDFWKPGDCSAAATKTIGQRIRIGFGADPSAKAWSKGIGLMKPIMEHVLGLLNGSDLEIDLLIYGGVQCEVSPRVRVQHLGFLKDEEMLNLFRCIDVLAFPATAETFGLTAAECISSGTPVVCFENTGPESVVSHRRTGYVARHSDAKDFAAGLVWASQSSEARYLAEECRARALSEWQPKKVGLRYAAFLRQAAELQAISDPNQVQQIDSDS